MRWRSIDSSGSAGMPAPISAVAPLAPTFATGAGLHTRSSASATGCASLLIPLWLCAGPRRSQHGALRPGPAGAGCPAIRRVSRQFEVARVGGDERDAGRAIAASPARSPAVLECERLPARWRRSRCAAAAAVLQRQRARTALPRQRLACAQRSQVDVAPVRAHRRAASVAENSAVKRSRNADGFASARGELGFRTGVHHMPPARDTPARRASRQHVARD